MSKKKYHQCELHDGSTKTTAWIEARGAKEGALVKFEEDGKFWTVKKVYKTVLTEKALRQKQTNDRNCLPSLVGA